MSFQIIVAVTDGAATAEVNGDVPDGQYEVAGHEDGAIRVLSVLRRGPDGRYVQQASATHHKES